MAKATKVTLCCPRHGMVAEFEASHAERILRMRNNGGWELPEDSRFEFDRENGITYKRHKKADSGAEKQGDD